MEKFIPYEKLSKKKKRELDAKRRGTWGALNPVTRKSPDPRAYNRKKARKQAFDEADSVSFVFRVPAGGFAHPLQDERTPCGRHRDFCLFKPVRRCYTVPVYFIGK